MRHSEFWALVADEFGDMYGRSIAADLVIKKLDDLTAEQALARGDDPRRIWFARCETMQVPRERWWGVERPGARPRRPDAR